MRSTRAAPVVTSGELGVDGRVPPLLREGERVPEQLLAGGEVVVDERLGDTGLVGDARHPQPVGALAHDHAAGRLEDPGGRGRSPVGRLLRAITSALS